MIDGMQYMATTTDCDDCDVECECATEINITAPSGDEYKNIFIHTDMAEGFTILRIPGATAVLFKRRPDRLTAEAERVCIEWTITCPLTGPHPITIHAPVSKRADRIDQLRIEFERRDMERRGEIVALQAEIKALYVAMAEREEKAHYAPEESRHFAIGNRILDYFDDEIYKYINLNGKPPKFMMDDAHWMRRELRDGYGLTKPHYGIKWRFTRHMLTNGRMPDHSPRPSAFEFMIARMGPGLSGGLDRIARFLPHILPHINLSHIIQTCEWIECLNINNCAAVAKILREHIAIRQSKK